MRLPSPHSTAHRIGALLANAVRRPADDLWPLLQGTAAATTAWMIARYVLGFPDPFFAPIAALVALNTALGVRGLNALRLLQGVIAGILVGEGVLVVVGGGFGSMALAIFLATAIARALGGARIVVAQAAVGAILTVAVGDGQAGLDRLRDALVGAGVALVFSQVLFSPDPLVLLRRAEQRLLARLAAGLRRSAQGMGNGDHQLIAEAMESLRGLTPELGELDRVLRASARVSRRTLTGRFQRALVVHESENANHLDLLHASSLLVARGAHALDGRDAAILAPQVLQLADVLEVLADGLGDRDERH